MESKDEEIDFENFIIDLESFSTINKYCQTCRKSGIGSGAIRNERTQAYRHR